MQRTQLLHGSDSKQLDSASEETATSSSQGRPTRIQFLQIPSRLQIFQRFLKNLQYSSKQLQVAKLPVQWMPFPTVPSSMQNRNSIPRTPRTPGQPRTSRRSTKGIPPCKTWTTRITFRVQTLLFHKGRCCDMGQNDTIGKIELIPLFVLSSDNTNCKNDIQ